MFKKKIVFFYLAFIYALTADSQTSLFYNAVDDLSVVETHGLFQPFDKNLAINNINIFSPFVEWRYYPDWTINRTSFKKIDSAFFKKKSNYDSSYFINPSLEAFYQKKTESKLFYALKSSDCEISKIKLDTNDSLFVIREIKQINNFLSHSSVKEYTMSDSLYEFFKKYPAQHEVLYEIIAIQGDLHQPRAIDLFGMQRLFVFDMRTKKLIYYKYKKTGIYADSVHFWLPVLYDRSPTPFLFNDFPKPEKVLKGYLSYLKQNKKYLKKH